MKERYGIHVRKSLVNQGDMKLPREIDSIEVEVVLFGLSVTTQLMRFGTPSRSIAILCSGKRVCVHATLF